MKNRKIYSDRRISSFRHYSVDRRYIHEILMSMRSLCGAPDKVHKIKQPRVIKLMTRGWLYLPHTRFSP